MPTTHYEMMIAAGRKCTGYEIVHKFGANDDVDTSLEDIWSTGGIYPWLTTATTLEVISDDANDTAAGTGAREVIIQGLDSNFNEIQEAVATNGLSASSSTTLSFLRPQRALVSLCGIYSTASSGGNLGNLTIRASSGGATHLLINVEEGIGIGESEVARYTVPTGKIVYINNIAFSVDGTKTANVYFRQRQNADNVTAPYTAPRLITKRIGLSGTYDQRITIPFGPCPPKTDIWASAVAAANNTAISCEFTLLVLDENMRFTDMDAPTRQIRML